MTRYARVRLVALTILLTFLPFILKAEQAPPPAAISSDSEAVLHRLETFSQLPQPAWRYHVGDLPHGEDPSLDDANWQSVEPHADLPMDALWVRAWIEVPKSLDGYDISGSEISFVLRVSANGPIPQIVYFNGRRVAMGTDLEPITLFSQAKPGEKVLVAVKLLHTEDKKRFRGSEESIQFPANRPNPEDFRKEATSACFLIPSLAGDPAAPLSQLEAAIHAVNLSALDSGNQAGFDDSLRQAQSKLMDLRPLLQQARINMSGNAHIDAAWLWPWTETVEVVRQTFGTALQLMDEYPKYTFSTSAAAYFEWLQQKYPSEFKHIQERVKEGRWELVGGMWVEPDLNMPDGESQVRQLLIGKRYFEKNFGVDVKIGWNPDSFGYNWQLPQIYKRSGVDYFVTQKMGWNDVNQLPLKLFWWQSPDGSRVLTYFPHDYVNQIEPVRMAQDFARARALNPGASEMLHLYGIGDHGGGPTRAMLDAGERWMDPDKAYASLDFGVAQKFFSSVEGKLDTPHAPLWNYESLAAGNTKLPQPPNGEISLPVWNDELYLEFHRGVFTTQAAHKKYMRDAEEEVLDAEKWSSIAWLSGTPYPADQLNEAWKKVLFNQFHDLAAGSGIATIYADAAKDYQMVGFTADSATGSALHAITSYIDTRVSGNEVPVLVFNPLSWSRTDVASFNVQMPAAAKSIELVDRAGKVLRAEISAINPATNSFHVEALIPDVPSLGYELIFARPIAAASHADNASGLKVSGMTLENRFLRVAVDPKTGCITSLINKQTNFDAIASGGCGNLLQAFHDLPKQYDAWNIDADFDKVFTNLDTADSVQLVDRGPLHAIIRVTRHWQNSKFVQDITLYDDLPRVDIVNDIDWHERHILLKAGFPLAASGPKATYEIPYGSIERPTTRNNSFEDAKFEVPALRWADLGDGKNGFSLINNSKYGYDDKGNMLRLSLLRSPTWPDPEADQGHHHFVYALYPHGGDWTQALTVRQGYDFNYALTATQVSSHSGALPTALSFLKVDAENVVVTAVKKTEDEDGLLVRFYEWAGKGGNVTLTVPRGAVSATLANLMEHPEGDPLPMSDTQHVTVPISPFEIQTVIVHYQPPNQGFLAHLGQ